nr:hypothetical protein [Candidatus Neomarinimicrobiota bacterium]
MKKIIYTSFVFLNLNLFAQTADQPSGSGTETDPYFIANLENLYWITENSGEWDKYYIQTSDIDASSTSAWDEGQGFTPMGNNSIKFTGSYDGSGYTINGLNINRPSTAFIGLFGYTLGSTIKDLGVINVNIAGGSRTGGLVGYNKFSSVSNCYSTGSVTGTDFVGGLSGMVDDSSTVNNCYSTSDVNGSGNVVGGLVGKNISSSVSNCYSTGSVTGTDFVGGIIGSSSWGYAVSGLFWNINDFSTDNGIGTGITTMEMMDAYTFCFAGWDFEEDENGNDNGTTGGTNGNGTDNWWDMVQDGNHYPVLSWQNGDTILIADLTNECLTDYGGCGDPTYNICTNNIGAPPTCFDMVANGSDLIVDQSALSQYMADDYLRFDVFQYITDSDDPAGGPLSNMEIYGSEDAVGFNERLDLSDSAPILGEQFSQEAWIYVDNTLSSPLER